MADDEWRLKAVHEQFNVFDTLTRPYKKFQFLGSGELVCEVADIKNFHLKMNKSFSVSPREISAEIVKHHLIHNRGDLKLSFIVIVTNIEVNGRLCKMPIFVLLCDGKKKYIDMNLTLFNSWKAFLDNNDLPACQFCFPIDGQYDVGGKLKIDFASSPAAIRKNINIMWKSAGFVIAVGLVVGSFFFQVPEFKNSKADSLLRIAEDFVPGIKKYGTMILTGVTIIQRIRSGRLTAVEGLSDLWKFMKYIHNEFNEEISWVFDKVRNALCKLYNWIKENLSYFFNKASKWAQDKFVAEVHRVDEEVATIRSEAEEILEASRQNHFKSQATRVAEAIHNAENSIAYTGTIFKSAKDETILQKGMEKNAIENFQPETFDLLEISNLLAQKLGKTSLEGVQDCFEALSSIIKNEYKRMVELYAKNLAAARVSTAGQIDVDRFNQELGIKGSPKDHFWREAIVSVLEDGTAFKISKEMGKITKQKKILILPIMKEENGSGGLYKIGGINGAGLITADKLINALKETQFDLSKDMVVNETSSMIMIRTEDLTFTALQELNHEENTSEGILVVVESSTVEVN